MDDRIEELIRALHSEQPSVRLEAARMLSAERDPRAIAALIEALQDEHEAVRRAAAEALRHIGELAIYPLCEALINGALPVQFVQEWQDASPFQEALSCYHSAWGGAASEEEAVSSADDVLPSASAPAPAAAPVPPPPPVAVPAEAAEPEAEKAAAEVSPPQAEKREEKTVEDSEDYLAQQEELRQLRQRDRESAAAQPAPSTVPRPPTQPMPAGPAPRTASSTRWVGRRASGGMSGERPGLMSSRYQSQNSCQMN